jgi:hypothetical protein
MEHFNSKYFNTGIIRFKDTDERRKGSTVIGHWNERRYRGSEQKDLERGNGKDNKGG